MAARVIEEDDDSSAIEVVESEDEDCVIECGGAGAGAGAQGDSMAARRGVKRPREGEGGGDASLDRSAEVPVSVLPARLASTLHAHANAVMPGLLHTGLARATLGSQQTPFDDEQLLGLLETTLGERHKMHGYSYSFVHPPETPPGCYSLRYRRSTPDFTPSKFSAYSLAQMNAGLFSSLPTEGAFSDDAYWASVASAAESGSLIHYPSDISASVLGTGAVRGFPAGWNMAHFSDENDLLRALVPSLGFKDGNIAGYTTPMLYVGAPGSTFAMHSEDQNLFSCNYLFGGAPKVWYAVPPAYYSKVVAFVHSAFANDSLVRSCPQAVMHKRFLLTPAALHAAGIPTSRIIQRPGDMILTAPGAFHFGYNTGLNLAEASNFAHRQWWCGGHFHDSLSAGQCKCKDFPRFTFDDGELRKALREVGRPFGITPSDL